MKIDRRAFLKSSTASLGAASLLAKTTNAQGDQTESIVITSGSRAAAEIVVGRDVSPVVGNAAELLEAEIRRRTGAQIPIRSASARQAGTTAIYLGTGSSNAELREALAASRLEPVTESQPGREGFRLISRRGKNSGVVVVNGCDDLGTFHGAGWLLRRMRFSEEGAKLASGLEILTAPATPMRRIRFGDHWGYVNTELPGWKEIWADYAFWGLSAVTMRCDPAHQGDPRASEMAKYLWEKWTERVPLARSLGLEVVHLTQTNLVFKDSEFGPESIPHFHELNYMCPDFNGVNPKFPRALEVLRESRKWFFDHLPHIDEVNYYLTSGWDGGGCKDPADAPWACTYAGLVDTIVYPLIAEHNPRAQVILGLYGMEPNVAGGIRELAAKLRQGWKPKWLYALEFDEYEVDDAPLYPAGIPRFYFPMWTTALSYERGGNYVQIFGANPLPRYCEQMFRKAWDQGIHGGTGCYSEGTHDFVNQAMMMQLAWDPNRPGDEILDEICRYYFGETAAPVVKKTLLLMEQEKARPVTDPLTDQDKQIQVLVSQADELMPHWARSSRQWALLVGRASIERTVSLEAQLMKQFDQHWGQYQSLLGSPPSAGRPSWLEQTRAYFQAVVDSAYEIVHVYKRMNRHGYGIIGGSQLCWWPDPRAARALDALTAFRNWKGDAPLQAPTRPAIALLDQDGRVVVTDGWSNYVQLPEPGAADARLVMADVRGTGSKQVVFLRSDGKLCSWSLIENASLPFAESKFLTRPLASGRLTTTQREEVLVLEGTAANEARLAIVDGKGGIRPLEVCPAGPAPTGATRGIVQGDVRPPRTVRIDFDPQIQVCDLDGDGLAEIVCTDRETGRLAVLDASGMRKSLGPAAPSGALAAGDLDGDGKPEVVFLDSRNRLAAFAAQGQILNFAESVRPLAPSAVAVVSFGRGAASQVVYIDADSHLRIATPSNSERLLTSLANAVAMAPALQVGDFDGDGENEVCYLRRHLSFRYPLAELSLIDANGDHRDLPFPAIPDAICAVKPLLLVPPLGPRASGPMLFPSKPDSGTKG